MVKFWNTLHPPMQYTIIVGPAIKYGYYTYFMAGPLCIFSDLTRSSYEKCNYNIQAL